MTKQKKASVIYLPQCNLDLFKDWSKYPYVALNSTTNKLYAYTHMPEWSGVDSNYFKVEGKQKRIPMGVLGDLQIGVVYKIEGVLLPRPEPVRPAQGDLFAAFNRVEDSVVHILVRLGKVEQELKAAERDRAVDIELFKKSIHRLQHRLDTVEAVQRITAPKLAQPAAQPKPKTKIMPITKAQRRHFGIPDYVSHIVQDKEGYVRAYVEGSSIFTVLTNFSMEGYDRINLVDWD